MIVTYRNNRLVPVIIITACFWAFYLLIDPCISIQKFDPMAPQTPRTTKNEPHKDEETWRQPQHTQEHTAPREPPRSSIVSQVPPKSQPKDNGKLTKDDILLIMKTGGTTMWKRLPIYLTTTLSPQRISPENVAIYSDKSDTIGSFTIIDSLANTTEATKSRTDFDVYRAQQEYDDNNMYVEAAGVAGDDWGPPGGWIIDKYKFVPLMQHAGRNWPAAKWYIYLEDDSYLFLPNILAYLDRFDWREPHYLGHRSAKSDVVFAHGGAGFALSRGVWERSFGRNERMTEDYEEYTAEHCCGDQVLGKALNDHGVHFGENAGDEKFTWGFNPQVHWATAFSRWNWCSPLMSWHKVHSRDVARYHELERTWNFDNPLLYRDFFVKLIAPALKKQIAWWDNQSDLFSVSSANKDAPPSPEDSHMYDGMAWKKAWESVDACKAACISWRGCVQWSYVEDLCKMDDKITMGQGYASSMAQRKTALMTTSGWVLDRLDEWHCEQGA